jgi:hypothetical protein
MTFEIPFDAKRSMDQYKMVLKLKFKKPIATSVKNSLASGVLVFFGWIMLSDKTDKGNIGYFFLALGFFYLLNGIQYSMYYMRIAKKLKGIYKDMVTRREKNKDTSIWEFNDVFFRYKDMYYDQSVNWAAFRGYQVIGKNLFLSLAESVDQSYIIGEEEIGVHEFSIVLAFVDGKIKNLSPSA